MSYRGAWWLSTVVGCPVQPGERLPDTDRKEEITCDTPYMWNRKEMIHMNLQNRNRLTDLENNLCLPEAGGGDGHVHIAVFKMGNQQGAAIQCMGLCSVLCGSLYGRRVWGSMDTCICMAESLHCSSETVTLLIGYIPIQNESFFFFKDFLAEVIIYLSLGG